MKTLPRLVLLCLAALARPVSVSAQTPPVASAPQVIGHESKVTGTAVSRDGLLVASVGFDELIVWDAKTGQITRELRERGGGSMTLPKVVAAPTFSPVDSRLGFSIDTSVVLIDLNTKRKGGLTSHKKDVSALVFSPDGKLLLSQDGDQRAIVWDMATGKPLQELKDNPAFEGAPLKGVFTVGDNTLVIPYFMGAGEIRMRFIDTATWKEKKPSVRLNETHLYSALALSPDGKVVFAEQAGSVFAFDTDTGKTLYQLPVKINNIDYAFSKSAAMTPDGKTLILAGALTHENTFHQFFVWDLVNRTVIARITPDGDQAKVNHLGVSVSPDGKTIYAGRGKKVVRFDVATGQELGQW